MMRGGQEEPDKAVYPRSNPGPTPDDRVQYAVGGPVQRPAVKPRPSDWQEPHIKVQPTGGWVLRYHLTLHEGYGESEGRFAFTRKGADRKARRWLRAHLREQEIRSHRWEVRPDGRTER